MVFNVPQVNDRLDVILFAKVIKWLCNYFTIIAKHVTCMVLTQTSLFYCLVVGVFVLMNSTPHKSLQYIYLCGL